MLLKITGEYMVDHQLMLSELVIEDGAKLIAEEDKDVLLCVNGVFTEPVPGKYSGNVILQPADRVSEIGQWTNRYRSALFVDGEPVLPKSMFSAVTGTLTATGLSGGNILIQGNALNGITVVNGRFSIDNTEIALDGNGGDDFELWGSAIAAAGKSKVVVSNTKINTKGVIATAVTAGDDAEVVVMNSMVNSIGTDNTDWHAKHPHLSETPWVLGICGTLRATNVLDQAHVTYYGCELTCNGWGVLSTDGTKNAVHNIINTKAVIPSDSEYASGYGAYILGGVTSTFLGVELQVPDFCLAVGGNNRPIVVGSSNLQNLLAAGENLEALKNALGGSFEQIPERPSILRSRRFIGMWHHVSTAPCTFLPGTILEAGDTAFLIKSSAAKENGPEIVCDDVQISAPRIVHLMESDDAGMGTRTHDKCWAPCVECWPANPQHEDGYDPEALGEHDANITLKNMSVFGDCWNSRVSSGQNLCITLDSSGLTGVVSSGIAVHRHYSYRLIQNEDGSKACTDLHGHKYLTEKLEDLLFDKIPVVNYVPKTDDDGRFVYNPDDNTEHTVQGGGIYYTDPQYLADLIVNASPFVNNGVRIILHNGSVWTPTGECWLSYLELDEDSSICSPVGMHLGITVDGEEVVVLPGERYSGKIHIVVG